MKKILICLSMLFLTGCVQVHSWKYTTEQRSYEEPKSNLTIVVPPMRDTRKNTNGTKASSMLALIPLVPYSKASVFNAPEGNPFILNNLKVSEDLAKTTAEELQAASIFKNVHFSFDTKPSDLILEATINKFRIKRYWTFYGLSLPGDLLWYLGLPAGTRHNDIAIKYELKDQKGNIYFSKYYSAHKKAYQGLYYNLDIAGDFEPLMKEINMELIKDLSKVAKDIKLKK